MHAAKCGQTGILLLLALLQNLTKWKEERFSIRVSLKITFSISPNCLTFQCEYTNQDYWSRSITIHTGVLFSHSQVQSLDNNTPNFLSRDTVWDLFLFSMSTPFSGMHLNMKTTPNEYLIQAVNNARGWRYRLMVGCFA